MSAAAQRYTVVAIILHWAIAVAILGMIPLGWWMGEALEQPATQAQAIAAFQLHKSIGLTVLALSVIRLAWRLMNPAPPLPEGMKPWERLLAKAVHWAFYGIIVFMPLTGWLYVSTAWSVHDHRALDVPTLYFGLFRVPHILGLAGMSEDVRAALAAIFEFSHSKLAWGAIGLAVLHVAAALKHQFVDKDGLLGRMIPGLGEAAPPAPERAIALAAGFIAIAIAGAAAAWAFGHPPTGTGAAPASVVHSHGDEHAAVEPDSAQQESAPVAAHAENDHEHAPAVAASAPPTTGAPPSWQVIRSASSIVFTGVHAGVPFLGRFSSWRADIRFDPANLAQSSAVVTVDTGSAADGVPLHDQSLPGEEWFDVANHPTATFRANSFRTRGAGAYEARGTLTIKDHAIELALPFTLTITGDRAVMDGTARIERRDADLGMTSDPDAQYVSQAIGVRAHVEATRAP